MRKLGPRDGLDRARHRSAGADHRRLVAGASRGGRGSGATRGSTCARASATGAGSRSWRRTWRRASPAQSFTAAGIDRYWSDNAPDHPGDHEDALRAVLAGVPSLPLHGADAGAASDPGAWPAHHVAAVRARVDRLPLPGNPVRRGAGRRWSTGSRGRWLPRPAAAAAAVLTLAQPHYFFHAPIACFDAPDHHDGVRGRLRVLEIAAQPALGDRGGRAVRDRPRRQTQRLADAVFPGGHYLWMRRGDLRARRLPRLPLAFVAMLVLGPLIFYAHWPWLWSAPVARTRAYVNRHLQHEHYNFEYLGVNWNDPPTTFGRKLLRATAPFVETGLTVPVTTLALAGGGRGGAAPAPRGTSRCRPAGESETPVGPEPRAQLAPPRGRRRSRAGRLPAGADARARGGARRAVDADLRRRQTLHDGDAVPGGDGGPSASPRSRRRWSRSCRRPVRACRAAVPGGAGVAVLPARGRGDAALASRRAVALQPARRRFRGRRVAGDEPPVLGVFSAAHARR